MGVALGLVVEMIEVERVVERWEVVGIGAAISGAYIWGLVSGGIRRVSCGFGCIQSNADRGAKSGMKIVQALDAL